MNIFNKILINLSIRPYKVVKLDTQLLVKHYRNGRLEAARMSIRSVNNGVSRLHMSWAFKGQPPTSVPCAYQRVRTPTR